MYLFIYVFLDVSTGRNIYLPFTTYDQCVATGWIKPGWTYRCDAHVSLSFGSVAPGEVFPEAEGGRGQVEGHDDLSPLMLLHDLFRVPVCKFHGAPNEPLKTE